MKKLLYLTTWDFSDGPSTGISKKIKGQIKAFEEYGFTVDYTCISNDETYYVKDGIMYPLGKVGKLRKLAANYYLYKRLKNESYKYVYNRYGLMDTFYFKLLSRFSRNGSKIVVELPTYPYDQERLPGLSWWMLYSLDKIYRNYLRKYVDVIATYSLHDEIFGIRTIHIHNGIDFNTVTFRNPKNDTDEIRLLAVAGLAKWHGYDRMLRGMGEYYRQGGTRKVVFHIVGDGKPLAEYKKIVEEYGIQQYCVFHGVKTGAELDRIYDICDIGVASLGMFRIEISLASSLKAREYAAKGLPFIMAGQSDVFENENFVMKVSENETFINIDDVTNFYDKMYSDGNKHWVVEAVRKRAESCCDMKSAMKPIAEHFLSI